jgi:hypothetical protein
MILPERVLGSSGMTMIWRVDVAETCFLGYADSR